MAYRVASFGVSWTFIILFLSGMTVWMVYSGSGERFDPYPFFS